MQSLEQFYGDFSQTLKTAEEKMEGKRVKIPDEETDEVCEVCGKKMVIKIGRFGRFLACSGFPECTNTRKIVQEMPEVDGVLGTGSYYDIVSAVGKVLAGELVSEFGDINAPQPEPQRILTTPEHYDMEYSGCRTVSAVWFDLVPKGRQVRQADL